MNSKHKNDIEQRIAAMSDADVRSCLLDVVTACHEDTAAELAKLLKNWGLEDEIDDDSEDDD